MLITPQLSLLSIQKQMQTGFDHQGAIGGTPLNQRELLAAALRDAINERTRMVRSGWSITVDSVIVQLAGLMLLAVKWKAAILLL